MTEAEIKNIIEQQLPTLIQNPSIRDLIMRTVSEYYAPKQETESKFDRILAELQRDREMAQLDREEQNRKWDENNRRLDEFIHQQNRKWDEQNRKWDENNRRLDELIHQQNLKWDEQNLKWEENKQQWHEQHELNKAMLAEIQKLSKKYDSTIGALGSRWGLYSEASFRNALKGILEESFGVQVLNVNEFDDEGEVFGRPDQVEIDVIIKNGLLILCEIKSSIDKAGMYIFDRKVAFYEKRHQRKANRKMVICPMVDDRAKPVATNLGIELYSYADSVELN
ncbi:PD-(D/E)XK nuclease family protein [Geminocystis herdmanii]|uniref:PD-(D/E)XK nuclease family protein n=1 Tax=Geminocystis herdmanii TaxID=669359 RepID=UPI000348BAAB|nr:DUF3782 domain-containing protein [Geminocystis herdmanii]